MERLEVVATPRHVDSTRREALSPAEGLIHTLHPWVAFGIMPIFALANAGVSVAGVPLDTVPLKALGGTVLGLVVGKPLGIILSVWLALKLRFGTLPTDLTMRHVVVLGVVAGVGFTMALFIASLAFENVAVFQAAKLGVLVASAAAALYALALGWFWLSPASVQGPRRLPTKRSARRRREFVCAKNDRRFAAAARPLATPVECKLRS